MGGRDVPLCEVCNEPDFPWGACACEREPGEPMLHVVAEPRHGVDPGTGMVCLDLESDHSLMVMSVGADCDGVQAGVALSLHEATELARQLLDAVQAVIAGPVQRETPDGPERVHLTAVVEGDVIRLNGQPFRVTKIERVPGEDRRFDLEPVDE